MKRDLAVGGRGERERDGGVEMGGGDGSETGSVMKKKGKQKQCSADKSLVLWKYCFWVFQA